MVRKISNQTVHHQSASKFASISQDIKKLPACKTAKILTAFLMLRQKKSSIKLGKQNVKAECEGCVTCASRQAVTLTQVFLTHLVGVFKNKTTQNTLAMFYQKFLRKKGYNYQMFCLDL